MCESGADNRRNRNLSWCQTNWQGERHPTDWAMQQVVKRSFVSKESSLIGKESDIQQVRQAQFCVKRVIIGRQGIDHTLQGVEKAGKRGGTKPT
jgi:hypothetical protein